MIKLVDQHNNAYHHSVDKKSIDAGYSAFPEETEINSKATKSKISDRVRITKYKNIFSKSYTQNWSKEIIFIDSVLKTNWKLITGRIKLKI